jgi:hypothetical protein
MRAVKSSNAKQTLRRLTAYEAAVKVGLLGCIEGPRDLAQNHHKYLRRLARGALKFHR